MTITYTIEAAWEGATTGLFTLDVSELDGDDVLSDTYTDVAFSPLNGDGAYVEEVAYDRGRESIVADMKAGTCTILIWDKFGKYDASNTASPLYGKLRPNRPVRVRASENGVAYGVFYGFLRRLTSDTDWSAKTARIEAEDLLVWMGGKNAPRPVIASTGSTTTGVVIGRVLDAVDWTDPAMRRLDIGDSIPGFSADGSKTALQLIAELLRAERGLFFIDGSGIAVYQDRASRNRDPRNTPQSTLTDAQVQAATPIIDLDRIYNRAQVTRLPGGVKQTYTDESSRLNNGYRDVEPIETPYLQSDSQAMDLAQYVVGEYAETQADLPLLSLSSLEPTTRTALLTRELGDHISAMGASYHIERLAGTIRKNVHTVRWALSKRGAMQPFILDVSELDGDDMLLY